MPMLLQVLPTPTGAPISASQFTTIWTGNFQTDLNKTIAAMNAKGDRQLATQFRAYALQQHASNPSMGMQDILNAFIALDVAGALGTAIGQTGTVLGQVPGAAAAGAEKAVNSLGGFNLSSWFLRIGEILLGLVLVGVGIARITGTANVISKAVKAKVPI